MFSDQAFSDAPVVELLFGCSLPGSSHRTDTDLYPNREWMRGVGEPVQSLWTISMTVAVTRRLYTMVQWWGRGVFAHPSPIDLIERGRHPIFASDLTIEVSLRLLKNQYFGLLE